jgi:hypothetical protein
MTAVLSRWCAPLSVTTSLLGQSTAAQLESGVRGNSPAPFGAGERPRGPTYRYLMLSCAARLRRQLKRSTLGAGHQCQAHFKGQ